MLRSQDRVLRRGPDGLVGAKKSTSIRTHLTYGNDSSSHLLISPSHLLKKRCVDRNCGDHAQLGKVQVGVGRVGAKHSTIRSQGGGGSWVGWSKIYALALLLDAT